MSGHAGPWSSSEQPGLEVNHQQGLEVDTRYRSSDGPEGLQVVSQTGEPTPTLPVGSYYGGSEIAHSEVNSSAVLKYDGHGQSYQGGQTETAGTAETAAAGPPPKTPLKRNKMALWLVVGVIAVLVVIGAVVGGVLGSKAANSSSNDASSDSQTTSNGTTTTNATSLNNIRSGSRLAVTGWRDGSNYRIRLFYQGPDQKLRSSSYASNESTWSDPTTLSGVEYAASNDTMLGASVSVESSTVSP
jgi:hypothetical protein